MANNKGTRRAAGDGNIRKRTVTRGGKSYVYWEARFTKGVDPGTGKRLQGSVSGKTQKEVRQKLKAITAAIDNGTYIEQTKVTVGQWMDIWIETFVQNSVKPLTLSAYQLSIKNYVKPALGNLNLQAVKGVDIQRLYNSMTDKGLSPKTVKNCAAILHKAFSVAMKQGYTVSNPCDAAELPKAQNREIKPLTDAEIPLFLDAIKEDDFFCNAYALCLFAGLREGECLGLSWGQVDFENNRLTISQQLQRERRKGGKYYIYKSTKSGKVRVIEPPPIAFDYLRAERVKQMEARLRAGKLWDNPDDLVFTNDLGGCRSSVNFYNRFKKYAAAIGRPDARPHDLRHTAATVAIASGADIKSVQDLMGHATASFTLNVYAHATDKMKADTAARMQSYYDGLLLTNKQA